MTPAEDRTPVDSDLLARLLACDAELAAAETRASPNPLGWAGECLELLARVWPQEEGGGPHQEPIPLMTERYQVVRELGRGGFGVVYLARDLAMKREVALKTLLPGMADSPDVRRRFAREALAVAGLDHPNIVPVYDARTIGPTAYIISAYCPGPTLATWLRERTEPVPPRLAARLIEALARGVAHAHSRGILHRDLKPANVMLQPGGDAEAAGMTPRLTDFGLAKMADESVIDETRTGLVIGSAPYMAPEQAAGRRSEVGSATDVYALGATLYEMLVGRPPIRGRSTLETLQQVLVVEPVPPQLFRREIPRDLQTICLHALRKQPNHRYPDAAAMGDDLQRFLDGHSILARPASSCERTWNWARRHPTAATSLVALVLLIGLVGGGMAWSNARLRVLNDQLRREVERADRQAAEVDRQRHLVADREALTDRHLHAARLNLARQAIEADQPERAQAILADASAATGSHRRDFAWRYLWEQSRRNLAIWGRHDGVIGQAVLSADEKTLASCDLAGQVKLWDVATRQLRVAFGDPTRPAERLAITPDGSRVAVAGLVESHGELVPHCTLYDGASGRVLARLDFPGRKQVDRVFFPDCGRGIAVVVADRAEVRSVQGWTLADQVATAAPAAPRFVVDRCVAVLEAPDHQSFWTNDLDGQLQQRDGRTGQVVRTLETCPGRVEALTLARDGRFLATAVAPARVLLWDLRRIGPPRVVSDGMVCPDELLFTGDAGSLLVVSGGLQVRLIRLSDGATHEILPLARERRGRLSFAASPDGRWIASVGEIQPGGFQPVVLWDVATGQPTASFAGRRKFEHGIFDATSRSLLLINDYDVAAWYPLRAATGRFERLDDHHDEVWSLAFSPDGSTVVSGGNDERIRFWNPRTGERGPILAEHKATVSALAWHPGGERIASACLDGENNVKLWDVRTGKSIATLPGHTDKVRALAFSPDGTTLASAGTDRMVRLWDGTTGASLGVMGCHTNLIRGLAYSRDGRFVTTVGDDRVVRVWDVARRESAAAFHERYMLTCVVYSPDGTTLASADQGGFIHLRDTATWQTKRVIRSDDKEIRTLVFAPDGETLVSAGISQTIRFWDPTTGQALMEVKREITGQINHLAFSPDGSLLIAADHGGRALIYHGPVD